MLQFQVAIMQSHKPCALIALNVVLVICFNNFESTNLECSLVGSLVNFVVNKSPKFMALLSHFYVLSLKAKKKQLLYEST
jgi:hypothetical protein